MTGSRILTPLRSQGAAPALFIVPAAGATPYTLIRLARALPVQTPIYSFFAAGFDEDTSLVSVENAASEYVREAGAVQESGPYRLSGHCAGGLVALEMAAALEARGEKVEVLILMDSLAPPTAGSSLIGAADRVDRAGDEARDVNSVYEQILKNALDKLGKVPGALAAQYGRNCLLEFSAAVRYQARRISAPIYLLRTEHLPESLYKGWANLTHGRFEQHVVPGDSNSMLMPPHVATLSGRISEIMAGIGSSRDFPAIDSAASP